MVTPSRDPRSLLSQQDKCAVVRVVAAEAGDLGLLGGPGPDVPVPGPGLKHVVSVAVWPENMAKTASLFLALDWDQAYEQRGVFQVAGADAGVWVAVGPAQSQRSSEAQRELVPEYGLRLGLTVSDTNNEPETPLAALSDHKIGGRVFTEDATVEAEAKRLADQGYVQVLQLDYPANAGDVEVEFDPQDWPLDDWQLSLLGREPFGAGDWVVCWRGA